MRLRLFVTLIGLLALSLGAGSCSKCGFLAQSGEGGEAQACRTDPPVR